MTARTGRALYTHAQKRSKTVGGIRTFYQDGYRISGVQDIDWVY